MIQERTHRPADATPEIEALFSIPGSQSIFERLMAMPRADGEAANVWERAVAGRLQAKLSGLMRERLERADRAA